MAAVLTAAGCSNTAGIGDTADGGWFSKPIAVFSRPEWAVSSGDKKSPELGPRGPVGPEELVSADGRCAPPAPAEPVQAAAPAAPPAAPAVSAPPVDRPVGSMAGDLAGPPMPAGPVASADPGAGATEPAVPPVLGGIALGMTECQAVRRAGLPGNVSIGAGEKGGRTVMLTYLTGPWPGIYHFADGRLKEIDRAPTPPEAPKAKPKKKKPVKKPKTAALHEIERSYVQ